MSYDLFARPRAEVGMVPAHSVCNGVSIGVNAFFRKISEMFRKLSQYTRAMGRFSDVGTISSLQIEWVG